VKYLRRSFGIYAKISAEKYPFCAAGILVEREWI
jgi:hypothetical protein